MIEKMDELKPGQYCEYLLNKAMRELRVNGIHAHKNNALYVGGEEWIDGEPFDYEIIADGHIHCIEAKSTAEDTFHVSYVKTHQLDALRQCKENGAHAYVLVFFAKLNKFVQYDVEVIEDALDRGKYRLAPKDGVPWQCQGFEKFMND